MINKIYYKVFQTKDNQGNGKSSNNKNKLLIPHLFLEVV